MASDRPGESSQIEAIFRDESARLIAWLTRKVGRFDLAEDAVAEAFHEALQAWPSQNWPKDPRAWLATTAHRRAVDRMRHQARREAESLDEPAVRDSVSDKAPDLDDLLGTSLRDEQLRLVFLCCHPALSAEAQIALTLKAVAGLSTPQIARAFLQTEPTVAQRIVRAKNKIRDAVIPFVTPPDSELPARIRSVARVVYLIFNEGYASNGADHALSLSLCDDAIRLARLLVQLMPDEPELRGLLALCLLQDSRREARLDSSGLPIRLQAQDRARWDRRKISEGEHELDTALRARRSGPYQCQAAIAALHARAPDHGSTDWKQIAGLYRILRDHEPSPVVALN
ncbi:MAG: sigma-70 family RNA polymerase sigma factor, partial [Planctomycetota bacterium]